MLPRYVPLRIGFLEVLSQIAMIQENDFPPKVRKGTFFPNPTMFHHFVVSKEGRNELFHLLRPYNFKVNTKG